MATIFELNKQLAHITSAAEDLVDTAQREGRQMTLGEKESYRVMMSGTVPQLQSMIADIKKNNTVYGMVGSRGEILTDPRGGPHLKQAVKQFTAEYLDAFHKLVSSGGKEVSAALYEGSNASGGYAVPITVDDQIVPLAPKELAVRGLAMVIPTSNDIKFPVKASFGTATAKAETASFTESELSLSQFTLSAFMAGTLEEISWELAQDVPAFQSTVVDDMVLAQQMYEENLYVNGTGSGQAQGLIGNVGAGVFEEADTNGNLVTITGTLDLIGTLNAVYHDGASFLMSRLTSIVLRKAQAEANLFFPAFTRVGNQDFLHGYPVQYSTSMPAATRGNAPILFGDFKRGYIIGDRGGSGINVKVLDQPLATQGLIQLLAYRRTDGRVRRSEAIQQYNISAS